MRVKAKNLFSNNKPLPVGSDVMLARPTGKEKRWHVLDRLHEEGINVAEADDEKATPDSVTDGIVISNFEWTPDTIVMGGYVTISFDYEQDGDLIEKFDFVCTWRYDDHNYVTPDDIGRSGSIEYQHYQGYHSGDYTYDGVEVYAVLKNGDRVLCGKAVYDYINIYGEDFIYDFDVNDSDPVHYVGQEVVCKIRFYDNEFIQHISYVRIRWTNDDYVNHVINYDDLETEGDYKVLYVSYEFGPEDYNYYSYCRATPYYKSPLGSISILGSYTEIKTPIYIQYHHKTEWLENSVSYSGNNIENIDNLLPAYEADYLTPKLYSSHAFSMDLSIIGEYVKGHSKTIQLGCKQNDENWDDPVFTTLRFIVTCSDSWDPEEEKYVPRVTAYFQTRSDYKFYSKTLEIKGSSGLITASLNIESDGVPYDKTTSSPEGTECPEVGTATISLTVGDTTVSATINSEVILFIQPYPHDPVLLKAPLYYPSYGKTPGPVVIYGNLGGDDSGSFEADYYYPHTVIV